MYGIKEGDRILQSQYFKKNDTSFTMPFVSGLEWYFRYNLMIWCSDDDGMVAKWLINGEMMADDGGTMAKWWWW